MDAIVDEGAAAVRLGHGMPGLVHLTMYRLMTHPSSAASRHLLPASGEKTLPMRVPSPREAGRGWRAAPGEGSRHQLNPSNESSRAQPLGWIEPLFHGTHQWKGGARLCPAICKLAHGEGGCFDRQGQNPARFANSGGDFLIRRACAGEESQS